MSREELALKLLQNELGDRPPTPENVMEEETERRIVKEMLKFSFAMRKTIDKLYSV
jgi:hypothetical protein